MADSLLQELEQRGFINQCSNMDGLKQALEQGKVTVYWGTDPTGDSLHVGHVASLMLLQNTVVNWLVMLITSWAKESKNAKITWLTKLQKC